MTNKIAHTIKTDEDADYHAIARESIWAGDGYTIWVFDDNSLFVRSGPLCLAVDADDAESVERYVKFLDEEAAAHDADRIQAMRDAL